MENQLPMIDMNQEQVINIIKFIDSSQSTEV